MKTILVFTLLGLAVGFMPAADFPQAEISNGEIRAKVCLPDAKKGFYTSTRFDWSGVICSLVYKGHEYYGTWFQKIDPNVYDFGYEGEQVVSAPFTAMVGPGEEFQTAGRALGFDEAKTGGTFIKIGVGVLRKADDSRYDHSKRYEIVDGGKWTVKKGGDSVAFTHSVRDESTGYAYQYQKVVRLTKGKPEMVLEHVLKNTGNRPIETTSYNHNFLALDGQPPGPDLVTIFPFQLKARREPTKGLGEIQGNQIVYLKTLEGQERMSTSVEGFGDTAKDYDVRVENRKVKAGVRIIGDRPLSSVGYWSIKTVQAVEPFVAMKIEPGKEFAWKITYEYYTLP
jgi:hypothetical protein